jgi:hypothetical protein
MDDVEVKLVEAVVRLAATRRLREKQLRKIKLLQESGKNTSAIGARLEESKRIIRELHRERKELAAKLFKKRANPSGHSPA